MSDEDRRALITAAAADAIAERGLAGASLRAVAARTGATLGLVTYYFANRDDLLAATMDDVVARLRTRGDVLVSTTDDAVRANLMVGLPLDRTSRTECSVWLAFADAATRSPELGRRYAAYYREWERTVSDSLGADGVATGRARAGARSLIATTDGIAVRALATRMRRLEQLEILQHAIDIQRTAVRVDHDST